MNLTKFKYKFKILELIYIPRCFFGTKISEVTDYQDKANEIAKLTNSKLKIVDPSLYHFTLHFFGEITDEQIDELKSEVKVDSFDKFEIELKNPGVLGNKSQVRVLYVDIAYGMDKIISLAQSVQNQIANIGYQLDKRPYKPHLTIARVKYTKNPRLLAEKWNNIVFKPIQAKIGSITLFKSILTDKGSIYEIIKEYELG